MPKRRNRGRKTQENYKRHNANVKNPPAVKPFDTEDFASILKLKAVGWITLISAAISLKYITGAIGPESYSQIPTLLRIVFMTSLVLVTIGRFWQLRKFWSIYYGIYRGTVKKSDTPYGKKLARWEIALSVTALTITFVPPLYLSGFPQKISEFLSSHFPELGTKISAGISFILTAIISGVLGNFVYDVLKKIVLRQKAK